MLKKPKILVVGSFNMDVIASTGRVPNSGETVIGMKFQTAPGGKGLNQAVQCARLGADVTMAGKVGRDDFGKKLLAVASEADVDVSHVLTDETEATGVAVILLEVTGSGTQNRITVCPGANFTITVDELAWLKEEIGSYDMLILQFELPMPVVETVAQWAHDAGTSVMVNPAPAAPMSDKLLSCATYLSPNEHEAAILANHEIRVGDGINFDDVKAVAQAFQNRGVENLIITMGGNGSVVAGKDGVHHTQCVKMPHVADPTAAGDSFVAAFCTGLTAGLSQEQALAFASHTAAITVSRMGAITSLPTLAEVQDLMRERAFEGFSPEILDGLR
ncbi:MAG: ribokinase [Oscillospiraceae bacterium]|nr:ribokinase [Oscillospiraceae bacterium]